MSIFDNTSINCFLTATNKDSHNAGESYETTEGWKSIKHCTAGKAEYFNMRFLNEQQRKDTLRNVTMRKEVLLATSALPVLCPPVKINGNHLHDGGLSDNSPVYPLFLATKCDTIIVIHLKTEQTPHKKDSFNENVSLLEIVPSGDTGGFFGGTINFDTEHAKELIAMGYKDSIEPLKKLVKNWVKEFMQSEDGKEIFQNIDHLSPEDKYRLYNECEFLVRGNYAKVKYITDSGFGKTILRVITGNDCKVKKQILENSQSLHVKMLAILECLDNDIFNINGKMDSLFYNEICLGDSLIESHLMIKDLTELLSDTIDDVGNIHEYLRKKDPDYPIKGDTAKRKLYLERLKDKINIKIAAINEQNRQLWELQQAETAKREMLISAAKEHRILRITPEKAFVISPDSITDEQTDDSGNSHQSSKVDTKIIEAKLSERNCDILVLPEDNKHPKNIKVIRPSDYFMFLWFVNTTEKDRAGKSVCMIDYYSGDMRVYGYEVNADGSDYNPIQAIKKNNSITYRFAKNYFLNHISHIFGKNKSFLFYRTFKSYHQHFEENLNDKKYYDIMIVKSDWEKVLTENGGELFAELIERLTGRIYE